MAKKIGHNRDRTYGPIWLKEQWVALQLSNTALQAVLKLFGDDECVCRVCKKVRAALAKLKEVGV